MGGPDFFKSAKEIGIEGVAVVIEAKDDVALGEAHEAVAGRDGAERGLVLEEFELWKAAAQHLGCGIGAGIGADEDFAGWRVQGYQFFASAAQVFAPITSGNDNREGHREKDLKAASNRSP